VLGVSCTDCSSFVRTQCLRLQCLRAVHLMAAVSPSRGIGGQHRSSVRRLSSPLPRGQASCYLLSLLMSMVFAPLYAMFPDSSANPGCPLQPLTLIVGSRTIAMQKARASACRADDLRARTMEHMIHFVAGRRIDPMHCVRRQVRNVIKKLEAKQMKVDSRSNNKLGQGKAKRHLAVDVVVEFEVKAIV